MSGLIFPSSLLGLSITPKKASTFNTIVAKALSGKTSRIALQPYPLYQWELSYQFLSDQFAQLPPRTNLIPYSQDFTQWTAFASGVALAPVVVGDWTGTQAPDGTYTADRVILNQVASGGAGTNFTADSSTVTADSSSYTADMGPGGNVSELTIASAYALKLGQQYAFSVWLKTNDGSTVSAGLFFTPEVTSPGSGYTAITVTPNWQRFTALGTVTSASTSPNLVGIGLGGASLYADLSCWGAQLETGSYASTYIMTNGAALRVSDLKTLLGLFSQMLGQSDTFLYQDPDFNTVTHQLFAVSNGSATPAFNLTADLQPGAEIDDYALDALGEAPPLGLGGTPDYVQNTIGLPEIFVARYGAPELLLTSTRTNLALQSNFASSWTASGCTFATNADVAPDGTTTAGALNTGSTTAAHYISLSQSSLLTSYARYSFSVWVKYVSQQYVGLSLDDGSANGVMATFDLVNGIVSANSVEGTAYMSAADASIEAFPGSWYRCKVSGCFASTTARTSILAMPSAASSWYPSFTGASTVFWAWGAQLEAGTRATALIPATSAHASNGGSDYSLTDQTSAGTQVISFQQVQFTATWPDFVPFLWSGSFWYRCRFSEDKLEPTKVLNKVWSLGKLAMESVIL